MVYISFYLLYIYYTVLGFIKSIPQINIYVKLKFD
nr:MAG TPA: hypothetical protein [Caudoviricetes sp.]